jgi:hypothetical protein
MIEFELRQRMPDLDKMNGWVFCMKYGGATLVERNFSMTFVNPDEITSLRDALGAYSHAMDCN